jgi:hypothetical protein
LEFPQSGVPETANVGTSLITNAAEVQDNPARLDCDGFATDPELPSLFTARDTRLAQPIAHHKSLRSPENPLVRRGVSRRRLSGCGRYDRGSGAFLVVAIAPSTARSCWAISALGRPASIISSQGDRWHASGAWQSRHMGALPSSSPIPPGGWQRSSPEDSRSPWLAPAAAPCGELRGLRATARGRTSTDKKETMGRPRYRRTTPVDRIGQVLPQHIEIDGDGWHRVRIGARR